VTAPAAIGISAHLGWAMATTIALGTSGLRVLRTDRLELAKPEDREIREPYHVAAGFDELARVAQPQHPEQSLKKGLERQRQAAARRVGALSSELAKDGFHLARAGLLVSRGRAATTFERAIASHTQVHIEEGIAVRESFRLALAALDVQVILLDQKALWSEASQVLGKDEAALLAELRTAAPRNGGPWRKEEQSAGLAAWLASRS
jgi:hypothetical protein